MAVKHQTVLKSVFGTIASHSGADAQTGCRSAQRDGLKESGLVCLGHTHSHELHEPSKHTSMTCSSQESPCLCPFFFFLPVWPICWIFFFPTRCFLESCQNFCPFPSCLQVPKPTYFPQISVRHLKLSPSVDVLLSTFASAYEKWIAYCLCDCVCMYVHACMHVCVFMCMYCVCVCCFSCCWLLYRTPSPKAALGERIYDIVAGRCDSGWLK